MNRRSFLKQASTLGGAAFLAPSLLRSIDFSPSGMTQVAFVKTGDRAAGVARAIDLLGLSKFGGKDFFIKPNFNSADATPGSTSEKTLAAIVKKAQDLGRRTNDHWRSQRYGQHPGSDGAEKCLHSGQGTRR